MTEPEDMEMEIEDGSSSVPDSVQSPGDDNSDFDGEYFSPKGAPVHESVFQDEVEV